jgi:hypothetical protein
VSPRDEFAAVFVRHPREMGESYGRHMACALGCGFPMIWAGLACFVHAAVPALFQRTASRTICSLHDEMQRRRRAAPGG